MQSGALGAQHNRAAACTINASVVNRFDDVQGSPARTTVPSQGLVTNAAVFLLCLVLSLTRLMGCCFNTFLHLDSDTFRPMQLGGCLGRVSCTSASAVLLHMHDKPCLMS
jgi:hypothetical protein